MSRSKHPVVRLAALGLAWSLAPATPALATGSIAFQLSAGQLCSNAVSGSVGDFTLAYQAPWCAASTTGGLQEAFVTFNGALQSQLPQPPEFYGYFREAQGEVVFAFPAAPPAGVQVAAATLLQHLLVVWILEEDGVAIVPIGDPIAFYLPAPPPYLAGTITGKARYGEPVEMTVRMTGDTHMLVVRQAGATIAATTLKKIFAHPDAMSWAAELQVDGDLGAATIWLFGDSSFRGVKSPAEVIIGSVPSSDGSVGPIERTGTEVRIYPR